MVDARPDTDDMFAASDIEGAGTPGPASSKVDVSTIRSQGVGVRYSDLWVFLVAVILVSCSFKTFNISQKEAAATIRSTALCIGHSRIVGTLP